MKAQSPPDVISTLPRPWGARVWTPEEFDTHWDQWAADGLADARGGSEYRRCYRYYRRMGWVAGRRSRARSRPPGTPSPAVTGREVRK